MTEVVGAELAVALTRTQSFALGGGRAIAIGSEPSGTKLVRTFEVDLTAATVKEHPLAEPRSGATVVAAPNGTLAILGGTLAGGGPALRVETFFP